MNQRHFHATVQETRRRSLYLQGYFWSFPMRKAWSVGLSSVLLFTVVCKRCSGAVMDRDTGLRAQVFSVSRVRDCERQ